uniref:Uncharacterized protein n=1 Tax=Rhizophora mucronata TaxID=61149 RepID=A0A2P2QEY7_RHIMU
MSNYDTRVEGMQENGKRFGLSCCSCFLILVTNNLLSRS